MNPRFFVFCVVSMLLSVPTAKADNWAHWRGPTGNGVSPNATPPTEWSDTKNVKWKVAIPGRGSGSPVIWNDQVFVVSAVPTAGTQSGNRPAGGAPQDRRRGRRGGARALPRLQFKLMCFNRGNGDLVWEQTATVATPQ